MQTQARAEDIADSLLDFELKIEEALTAYGRLTTTLSTARAGSGVAVGYGQKMFDHLPELGRHLVAARGEAGKLHRTASAVARKLNVTAGAPERKDEPDHAMEDDAFMSARRQPHAAA